MTIILSDGTLLPTSNFYTKSETQEILTGSVIGGSSVAKLAATKAAAQVLVADLPDGTWIRVNADESQEDGSSAFPATMYLVRNNSLEFQYYIPV